MIFDASIFRRLVSNWSVSSTTQDNAPKGSNNHLILIRLKNDKNGTILFPNDL
jgi:hypothetical protein